LNQLKESKNPNKIQEINFSKESNQESNNSNKLKDLRLDLNLKSTFKESNLDFNLQKDSKIQDLKNLNQLKESKNLNKIQMKSSKTTLSKISISIIASILLSQSLVALPSGGKFVGGSSGSIKVNGKEMNITGNNTNHIIAWGGGFNINKGESVNFLGNNKSYLNLDYTNKASQILGNLNGNGNNIYLVNPSGVLIGQNASINANKFVASNIIDDTTLNNFKTQTKLVESFSPVFKPNKGNIVNLGTIKANNGITLIGDTIDIRGGKIENTKGGTNKDNSIYFVGENIYIDADAVNLSSNNIYATAFKEGYIQRQMKNFQKDGFTFGNFNQLITNESYAYNDNGDKSGQSNFKKVITLGNGNADEALSEWYWFANGWNNNNGDTRSVDEFRLVGNIDFSKQIGGKDRYIIDFSKNENDIDRSFMYSGNYYDPNNDNNYNGNMVVGKDKTNLFQGVFDGGRNTLSNVDIDYANSNYANYIGVFGYASNSTISNLNLDKVNIAAKKEVKKSASGESIGSLLGYGENLKISNIFVKDVDISFSAGSYTANLVQDKIGGFIGDIKNSTLDQIILDGFNINTTSEAGLALIWAGGFFGRSIGVNASNVAIQGNNNIKVNMLNLGGIVTPGTPPSIYLGGFAGLSQDGNLKNISIAVDTISGEGQDLQHAVIGGFAGWGHQINGDNINLNIKSLFGKIKGRTQQGSGNNQGLFMGGFGGRITSSDISNISINNIEEIVGENTLKTSDSFNLDSDKTYIGGFAGNMQQSGNKISNVVLNNIGKLSGVSQYDNVYIAGFVGSNDFSNVSFNNIYLYFNPNSTILAEANNGTAYKGKFYGSFNNFNPSLSNIHLYYKDGTLNGINSDSKDYHSTSNPNGQIFLNPYVNETQGKETFKQALEKQNNLGGAFESNKIVNIGDDSNPIYSFEQTTSSDITPPTDSNTPDINWGNVVLEGSDFSVSILQEIINDILNGKYGINIDNREVLSNLAESLNNANTLQDYFNAINSYLISSSLDESTKESIRQSMDFLVAFYGENGLGNKFKGDTNYKDFYDKSFYISTSLKDLGNFISGDLNGRLDSMIKNIQILESLKQRIKAAQKYYQEALEAKLPYETLEGIYNGMVKTINESYIQALGVLETLKGEDRDYLIRLYKEYSIKEDSGFDDIRGTFSFSGNDILSKIDSIILEDKPALTPPTKEEVGDDPTKENNPNIPNNLQKIADLASKEAILILPAQEKQEAIVEDGKERGRLCIVSDNAKTNNPCMAITY
ncbi:filamentous hemagglutinin N-terminal domain-containing protein, partial [Helicobacter pullorum]|uniref:filamentous hemagglutinin N-terminal domain-containing protein n=1 Tax=Helicobacter pullorum TaxID=35818 RepID=UPI00081694EE